MEVRASAASILCWLVLICTCATVSGVLTAKAFYCRDPDTGKLYPVNSTWHSSSFCGRYTCKLRKRAQDNQSTTEQSFVEDNATTTKELNKNCSQPVGIIVEEKANVDKTSGTKKEKSFINLDKFKIVDGAKNIQLAASTMDGDRYLTEDEITALSLLLQTMKKSDLEAILEVYNLAQDIYKELDKTGFVQNNTQGEKGNKNELINNEKANKKSYWYEPLTATSTKIKEGAEVVQQQQEHPIMVQVQPDPAKIKPTNVPKSFYEGLNMLQDIKNKEKLLEILPKIKLEEKQFFEGPLARNDFRMLPYYHPLTNFQKMASYVRPTGTIPQAEASFAQSPNYSPPEIYSQAGLIPTAYIQLQQYPPLAQYLNQPKQVQQDYMQHHQMIEKPANPNLQHQNAVKPVNQRKHGKCCKPEPPYRLIPWSEVVKKTDANKYDERKIIFNSEKSYEPKNTFSVAESKVTAQNLDLPLAYLQNYNLSNVNPYNGENAWSLLELGSKPHRHQPSQRSSGYVAQIPHDDIPEEDVSAEVKEEEQLQNVQDAKDIPAWQTDPLTMNEINEVKANIAKSKFLPYPFRKKVKLERVGRVRRIDDGGRLKRNIKRGIDIATEAPQEEYEVYIEKSTCKTDTEPGFFRMGNTSEPYPACCPQRIPS